MSIILFSSFPELPVDQNTTLNHEILAI